MNYEEAGAGVKEAWGGSIIPGMSHRSASAGEEGRGRVWHCSSGEGGVCTPWKSCPGRGAGGMKITGVFQNTVCVFARKRTMLTVY